MESLRCLYADEVGTLSVTLSEDPLLGNGLAWRKERGLCAKEQLFNWHDGCRNSTRGTDKYVKSTVQKRGWLQGSEMLLEALCRCQDETQEWGRRLQWAGQVLGVELHTQEERVICQFDNLHALSGLVLAHEPKALGFKLADHLRIDLVAVTMAFHDSRSTPIQLTDSRVLSASLELGGAGTQTHGASKVGPADLGHVHDNRRGSLLVQFDRVGIRHIANMASKLDHSNLKTQADPEIRDPLLAGPFGCSNLTIGSTVTKSSGDKNALGGAQVSPGIVVFDRVGGAGLRFQIRGFNPLDDQLFVAIQAGMLQGFDDGCVRVLKVRVFADQSDGDGVDVVESLLGTRQLVPLVPHLASF